MKCIPVADSKVHGALSSGLDQIDQLRRLIRDAIERKDEEILVLKRAFSLQTERLVTMQKLVKQVQGKLMPKICALIEVDVEYLKRTIQENRMEFNESVKGQLAQLSSDPNDKTLSKINALNAIVCHQQVLELVENAQIQFNAYLASGFNS